jgi:hypothetical protein
LNFNTAWDSIVGLCKDGLSENINNSDFPMFFWEPSHEEYAQFLMNNITSESCQISDKLADTRFAVTSNLEREQL